MITTRSSSPWFFGPKPAAHARQRLFCFPHAGGGASSYRSWAGALPPEIELCAVQLPGRENRMRESPFMHFTSLMEALAEALQPYLTVPFALYGHSMGALISFGLARQLRRQGHPLPVHLFLSSYRAPHLPYPGPLLHTLPEPELVQILLRLNGTKREVLENMELRQFLLPIMRADFSVCETYRHVEEEPLSCPITVFGGLQDTRVQHNDLIAWQEHTRSTFSLRMLPGDHFFLQPMYLSLLRMITQNLHYQK